MDLTQAIEHANAFVFPGFIVGDEALTAERSKNEEALKLLSDAWWAAPAGREPFSFDLIRGLADRNRGICDDYGIERLHSERPSMLSQHLSDADLLKGCATMQHRSVEEVSHDCAGNVRDLGIAYVSAPVSGTICGIDIETTDRDPARGYIVNVGLEFMELAPKAKPHDPFVGYCGLPAIYEQKGVPLSNIHHITWKDVAGKIPFRENQKMQKALLVTLSAFPYMAHNAAFEDSWFTLHIKGYAEARKAGKVVPIDTRDICRKVDPETRTLPHEQRPAALESWARRRGTLKASEKERHLGLEDVDLMFRTVQAEFKERNMF